MNKMSGMWKVYKCYRGNFKKGIVKKFWGLEIAILNWVG